MVKYTADFDKKGEELFLKNFSPEVKIKWRNFDIAEIAEKLFISEETIISHRKHLLSKFKVHNSAELIRAAMENNLL